MTIEQAIKREVQADQALWRLGYYDEGLSMRKAKHRMRRFSYWRGIRDRANVKLWRIS